MANLKIATTNDVKIDKDVPLPASGRSSGPAWPFRAMEIGDSFSFSRSQMSAVRSAATYEQRVAPEKKFTIRTLPHEIRCWRVR